MDIIYMAGSYSTRVMDWCFQNVKNFTQLPGSKFHYLIAKGFLKNDIKKVHFVCSLPFDSESDIGGKIEFESENDMGIEYHYAPYYTNLVRRKCAEVKYLRNTIKNILKNNSVIIICDVLNATASSVALKIAKKRNIKCYGIITDLPSFVNDSKNLKSCISKYIANKNLSLFDGYIVITEAINDIVNKQGKPYVVVECVTDKDLSENKIEKLNTLNEHNCRYMYAGGMNKKYGIPELVEGFKIANLPGVELHLYGNGDYVELLKKEDLKQHNIVYHGVVKNELIVEEEKKASLLINPRSPYEEFAKYSFPSKNMEYMSSGTPMIGYKLPGIPEEYFSYMYLFEEFSPSGVADALTKFYMKSYQEHVDMGIRAKKFITEEKNNRIMAKKILDKFVNCNNNRKDIQ